MERLKSGAILLVIGLAIEISTSFGLRDQWLGKVIHAIAQTVMVIGLLLGAGGIISWML